MESEVDYSVIGKVNHNTQYILATYRSDNKSVIIDPKTGKKVCHHKVNPDELKLWLSIKNIEWNICPSCDMEDKIQKEIEERTLTFDNSNNP